MAKEPISGWIHEPLAAVLGTRAKVAVLRILWRASEPLAYREVVRRSGMAYRSIDLALRDLTAAGLAEAMTGGRERRVRLCAEHKLLPALSGLLQVDADYFPALRVELRAALTISVPSGLLSAAIVGAAARREEVLGRDIDIVLIARDEPASMRCRERLESVRDTISARFGVRLKAIVYDLDTARTMWHTRTPAAARDVQGAELLVGTPLADLFAT